MVKLAFLVGPGSVTTQSRDSAGPRICSRRRAGDGSGEQEAPIFAEPGPGEVGYRGSGNTFQEDADDVDRTNASFGSLSRLTERDRVLGDTVTLPNTVSKEGKPMVQFYRSAGPTDSPKPILLMLHGLPSSSYAYRGMLPLFAEKGYRAIAPDMIGFGFSDKPQPKYGFDYTKAEYDHAMDCFLEEVGAGLPEEGVDPGVIVVVNGWLGATWGIQYALEKLSTRIKSLVILNSPLPPTNPSLPFAMSRWGLPGFIGDTFCQDPMSVERALEGGGPYFIDLEDANVYRRPYMLSGDSGFALGAAVRNLKLKEAYVAMESLLKAFEKPVLVAWGEQDKYLTTDQATAFKEQVCPKAKVKFLDSVGHYAAEDYPERVTDAILQFL